MISFRRAPVLMLTIMGSMAEFERSLTKARCDEGIAKARRQGKKLGRPSALDNGQRRKIAERYAIGETMEQLASEYEVGVASIWRALNPSPFAEAAQAARSERRDVEIAGTAFRAALLSLRPPRRASGIHWAAFAAIAAAVDTGPTGSAPAAFSGHWFGQLVSQPK
jgi:hypothetical protein